MAAGRVTGGLPDVLGDDRAPFADQHTVVVGAGHSAANTLLALVELAEQEPGTTVTWAIRADDADRAYGGEQADALPPAASSVPGCASSPTPAASDSSTGFRTHAIRHIGRPDRVGQPRPRRRRADP